MTSSIQSVADQPVAAWDSIPMHQGASPSALIWSERASNSSQVSGTLYPAASKSSLGYQTRLLTLVRWKTPAAIGPLGPVMVAISSQLWLYCLVSQSLGMKVLTSTILPCVTKVATFPGCGKSATSGAWLASTAMEMRASNSLLPT